MSLGTDRNHCGACGNNCSGGQVCSGGTCQLSCGGETPTLCGLACVDTDTDRNHCGACDDACDAGEVCSDGACALSCGGATPTLCGDACVDLGTDADNCGGCGVACAAGEVCSGGTCGLECGGATPTLCGTACVDTQSSRANCGGCGLACDPGEVCSGGTCGLSCGGDTPTLCGSSCIDTDVDRNHCGGCGNTCAAGEVCSGGICSLSCGGTTSTLCGSACVDTRNDRNHCGGCGIACDPGEICSGGACVLSCAAPTQDCGGACVNTASDRMNCGGCGIACAGGRVCSAGSCVLSCAAPTQNCAGACVNTSTDRANCGGCGVTCDAGEICSGGSCVLSCADPTVACGAACVNTAIDPSNCGGCGTSCGSPANAVGACLGGDCNYFCSGLNGDCNRDLGTMGSDGCETSLANDRNNCGACGSVCIAGSTCSMGRCTRTSTTTTGSGGFGTNGSGSGTSYDPGAGGLIVDTMPAEDADYLWVPNTAESTLSRWDARTATEVGRYLVGLPSGECRGACCWDNNCNMPSRVAVDGRGDAYVANRGFNMQGTVAKIAGSRQDCVDRNGNGRIDTSTNATPLPWNTDECILWTANVGPVNAVLRALAIDAGDAAHPEGYPWVGGYNNRVFYKLDPDTGAVLQSFTVPLYPYGAVVLPNGRLFVGVLGGSQSGWFDTTSASPTFNTINFPSGIRGCNDAYGITADGNGRVWFSGWGCQDTFAYDPATGAWSTTPRLGTTSGRGVTVDPSGRIWTATYFNPYRLHYWDASDFVPNGVIPMAQITTITMPPGNTEPAGIGADSRGIIWSTSLAASNSLLRIDPATGVVQTYPGTNRVYTYSDFTGGVRRSVIATGVYDEVIDGICDNPSWSALRYDVTVPMGAEVQFVVRTADTEAGLSAAPSTTVATIGADVSPANLALALSMAGVTPRRYLRLTSILRGESGVTPVLESYTIDWECP